MTQRVLIWGKMYELWLNFTENCSFISDGKRWRSTISDKISWHTVAVVKTHAISSIYHTILLNRIRRLVASWSILLYLRFDSNGSLSWYDVQKHRNIAALLLFILSGWCRNFGVHFESDERRYVSNISGYFSQGVICFGFAFFIIASR